MDNELDSLINLNLNEETILQNLNRCHEFLLQSEFPPERKKFIDFLNCINCLNKSDILLCNLSKNENINESQSVNSSIKIKNILISITQLLCSKYVKHFLSEYESYFNYENISLLFDTTAYLLRSLIVDIQNRNDVYLIEFLTCFNAFLERLNNTSSLNAFETAQNNALCITLKFLSKCLDCISSVKNHQILDVSLKIINNIPYYNLLSVKCFVNYVLPVLLEFPSLYLEKILKIIWCNIYTQYNESRENDNVNYCYFVLLYSVLNTFNGDKCLNLNLFEDVLIWEIVQTGLVSDIVYKRKIAANIFKLLLSEIKKINDELTVYAKDAISIMFSTNIFDNYSVWNDIIILLEALEEKQIHIIKPVLPKFSRIMKLSALSDERKSLNSSWSLIIFHRLLKHESKCIVKWALEFALSFEYCNCLVLEEKSEEFLKLIIESMNDQVFFSRTCEQDHFAMFLSSEKVAGFLINYTEALKTNVQKVAFLRSIIRIISSLSWSVVPLLHLISALTKLEAIGAWSNSDVMHVRKIISECQRGQETTLRKILEKLIFKCCCLFLDWESFNLEQLVELLILFKNMDHLKDIGTWKMFSLKLKEKFMRGESDEFISKEVHNFCEENIKIITSDDFSGFECINTQLIEKAAKNFLTLFDASLFPSNSAAVKEKNTLNNSIIKSLINPVLAVLLSAINRPYMPINKFLSSLQFISCLISDHGRYNYENDIVQSIITECFCKCPEIIEFILQLLFSEFENNQYITKIKTIFEFLDFAIHKRKLALLFLDKIQNLIEKCTSLLKDDKHKKLLFIPLWSFINKLYFQCLDFYSVDKISKNLKTLNSCVILDVIENNVLYECLLGKLDLCKSEKESIVIFLENSICQFWIVSSKILHHSLCNDISALSLPLIEEISLAFVKGPKCAVPFAILCLQHIIPLLVKQDFGLANEVLDDSWKTCLELRGNEAFKPAINSFTKTVFQESMLEADFHKIISEYFEKLRLLSENILGLFFNVVYEVSSSFLLKSLIESTLNYIPILVHALTHGPSYHKGQKAIEDTLVYFLEDNSSFVNNELNSTKPSIYVRVTALNYLFKNIQENNFCRAEVLFQLLIALFEADINHYDTRTSRFSNSFSHRVRNRIWQAICLLQPFIDRLDLNKQILQRTFESVETKTHQPSIRYLMEWTIFNILRHNKDLLEIYFSVLHNMNNKRPSFIITILSVLHHLIFNQVILSELDFLQCFPPILVQCMAQNFTVRLYAQTTMINLFNYCQKKNFTVVTNKYEFVLNLIETHEMQTEQGNFARNVKKLSGDFYFTSFDPVAHFSLETIFYDFPRLCNLPPDEWIKPSLFDAKSNKIVPIENQDSKMKDSCPTEWSLKAEEEKNPDSSEYADYNFQKKIIPLKDFLSIDDESLSDLSIQKISQTKSNLIIVASLVDRIPNLGGLCRTCEIFGVREFVIGSMKYTEDKQFQTLAVSSDKWVKIKEVKSYLLKEYLNSMKDQGYVLIGAEQTENSCYLQDYTFPEKSLLILGHEKEGLPIDLIQLLDVCVEVPQQGVVRSLNVHVTGAILIWEYTRQHLNKILS